MNSCGREAGREADQFAVGVLPKAGYDPGGLTTFFTTLARHGSERGAPRSSSFLSDHPATEERIAETEKAIAASDLPAGLREEDGGRLEIIQRRILLLTGAARPSTDP